MDPLMHPRGTSLPTYTRRWARPSLPAEQAGESMSEDGK